MTLADYLATEQAREDIKALIQSARWDSTGTAISVNPWPHEIVPRTKLHTDFTVGPWIRCSIWSQDEADNYELEVIAYYRPDGDRFVVTDLGEGVRALRLRTGWIHGRANGHAMQERETLCRGGLGWLAGMSGDIELDGVKEEQLPDAICRVMLASLRVAGVQR